MPSEALPLDIELLPVKTLAEGVEREDNEIVSEPEQLRGKPRLRESVGSGEVPVPKLKRSKKQQAARALESTGGGWVLRRLPTWRGLLILNYHRIGVAAESDLDRDLWSATAEDFRAQLTVLKRDCDVIGLDRLDDALARPSGRSVMITFDDGYRDNYTHAYPALRDAGLPATFFVTTGFLDRRQIPWWDEIAWMVRNSSLDVLPATSWTRTQFTLRPETEDDVIHRLLKIYKQLEGSQTERYVSDLAAALQTGRCPEQIGRELWMTWDMVRELRAGGMTIGGHSVSHPILASLPADQQDYEVGESRRRLVAELGEPIDAFSYPVGGGASFNEITQAAVERHGYRWGFTYLGGYLKPGRFERYALRRTAIETDIDLDVFRAMMVLPQYFT